MLFELLSNGEIVSLPGIHVPPGLPSTSEGDVVLLLPFRRALVGRSLFGSFEKWQWGKIGHLEWEEIPLYDGRPVAIPLPGFNEITLSGEAVTALRSALASRMEPPGDAVSSLVVLEESLKALPSWREEFGVIDRRLSEALSASSTLRTAFWGIRFALLWGGREMLQRIRTWLRLCPSAFEDRGNAPKQWLSLGGTFDPNVFAELETLGYSGHSLRRLDLEESNPAVIRGPEGILLQVWLESSDPRSGLSELSIRSWIAIPSSTWEDLRGRRNLSLREIGLACWGFLDAVEGEKVLSAWNRAAHQKQS
ncbi:MAG: hypothetical protein ACC613_00630 [Synergistales bacterium]|jgi:hypothetical protein